MKEVHDLAVDGTIPNVKIPDFFCQAIDETREAIWSEVVSMQQRAGTVYGVGIEMVQTPRPDPCAEVR